MTFLSGRGLTLFSLLLAAAAAAGAVRVAADGRFALPATAVSGVPGPSAAESLALAREADRRGDVDAALSQYRKAVVADPSLADRLSPSFLGSSFEAQLKGRIEGLKSGRLKAGPSALPDASFLFRRMYGGCG
jgi:hypothetical protein